MSNNLNSQVMQDLIECRRLINSGVHTFIVRPTFYPKEELLASIINDNPGNKLVIHMNDEDRSKIYSKVVRKFDCDFISYRKLALSGLDTLRMKYSLIIFNEANLMGGDKVGDQIDKLITRNNGAVRIGITSTPFRNDNKNIRQAYFLSELSQFGMQEAVDNKIIPSLYYVYCSSTQSTKSSNVQDILNISSIINKTLAEVYTELPDVFNIVCFIDGGTKKQVAYNTLKKMLFETFSDRTIVMENETKFGKSKKCIIVDINPNLNRHIESAHIAMIFRQTYSQRVFIKQLGSILDCEKTNTPIVFDMVDNLNKKNIMRLSAGQLSDEFKREANVQISKIIVRDYLANNKTVAKKVDKHSRSEQININKIKVNQLNEYDIDYTKECLSRKITIAGKTLDRWYLDKVHSLRYDYKMPVYRIALETETALEMVIVALSLQDKFQPSKNDCCTYKGPKLVSRNVNAIGFMQDYSIGVRASLLRKRKIPSGLSQKLLNKEVFIEETIIDILYRKAAE